MNELLRKKTTYQLEDGIVIAQNITFENTGLKFTALKVINLEKNTTYSELNADLESCIVILEGKATVTDGKVIYESIGRRNTIFDKKPTDSVYISNNKMIKVQAEIKCKILIAYAPSNKELPTKLIEAEDVLLEKRGLYMNKRYVQTILSDQDIISENLLVVEVYTGSGNWSSYPPHKHDQDNLPKESFLEEIYYHEINPKQGFVLQRVYTDDGELDEVMAVNNEDVVLVPKGYHPVAVPDGYESYYLNVMAGPTKIWRFHNHPDHEWILNRE